MTQAPPTARRWLLAVDPRVYHWDTLFVKGKEMWRHAGAKPDALRQIKQAHKGDRALCYHGKAEHSVYALAEVSRDPYPDPHDTESKKLVMDLRACCQRGLHAKDDCGFPQNHPNYEFCARRKPPYLWAVAPDADTIACCPDGAAAPGIVTRVPILILYGASR